MASAAAAGKPGRPTTPVTQAKEMQEYLLTFMPCLTDGLTEMSLTRPKDPHAYLAQYILSLSQYPQKAETCEAILEHARDPNAPQAETVVGGGGGSKGASQSNNSSSKAPAAAAAAHAPAPLHIIIAGAPCSGKGTQCDVLKDLFGVVHLSTGDLLRAEVEAKTARGLEARKFMDEGKLIPDDMIIDLVKEKVNSAECKARGWMLDGFPRTAVQALALEKAGIHADVFLQLNVPDEILVQRVTGRRLDPQTGKTYHVDFDPPPPAVAKRCVQRSDDTEAKIQTRLRAYHDAIDAISDLYSHVKHEFDGNVQKEHLTKRIVKTVQKVIEEKRQGRAQKQ